MSQTVLQLMKVYKGNAKLINEMAKAHKGRYRTVTCYMSGTPDGYNQMENVVDETVYLNIPSKKVIWTCWSTLRKIAQLIDEKNIDLVVCQFRRPIPIGILASKISNAKPQVIGVLHGIVGGKVGLGRKIINLILYRYLTYIVSVSINGISDIIRMNWGIKKEKVVAIQNGIDFEPIINATIQDKGKVFGSEFSNKFLFGAVGRLTHVKNHQRLLSAFKILSKRHANIRLVIVGKGPIAADLGRFVEQHQMQDLVCFTGFRQEIPTLLKSLDVYVMPSLREGLPLALLEAMAAGLPIITSNTSGMKEVIGDCDCGELVNPEDVNSIVLAMEKMLSQPTDSLVDMGQRARERALNKFSSARMVSDYEALYSQILGVNVHSEQKAVK